MYAVPCQSLQILYMVLCEKSIHSHGKCPSTTSKLSCRVYVIHPCGIEEQPWHKSLVRRKLLEDTALARGHARPEL